LIDLTGNGHARKIKRYRVEDRGYLTPCHIWQLATTEKGYGQEWDASRGRMNFAHITAWERKHGPVPDGKELDHLCRVRPCVNDDHLEPVTHLENIRRGRRHETRRTPELERQVLMRLAFGFTQNQIAELLDIGQSTVSRIKRGVR